MIRFEFDSRSENEAMARVVIAAYLLREDPTIEEMADVKTAVSEAVTNAIIHGYTRYWKASCNCSSLNGPITPNGWTPLYI